MKHRVSSMVITRRNSMHAIMWRKMMKTTLTFSPVFTNGALKLIRGVALLLMFFAAARNAHAQYPPAYLAREAWMAAQGEATFSSFETSDAPLGYFSADRWDFWEDQGVRFTALYGGLGVETGSQNNYGYNLAEVWGVDPSTHALRASGDWIRWDVTVPATSIAIEVGLVGGVFIACYYADGTNIVRMGFHEWTLDYQARFYGVVGTAPIVRVELYLGDDKGGENIRSYLKSFSFGNSVPAPPVAILFLGGLIGMSRRRS